MSTAVNRPTVLATKLWGAFLALALLLGHSSASATEARRLTKTKSWQGLQEHREAWDKPDMHLRQHLQTPGRLENFSLGGGGLYLDFARQRVTEKTMALLHGLARERHVTSQFHAMAHGELVNVTEKRAALHTAARDNNPDSRVRVDGKDVMPEIRAVREQIGPFVDKIHRGEIVGSTGDPFTDVVVVGIGGSYLGTEFVGHALADGADKGIRLHYLANVDSHTQGRIARKIDPSRTLWVVVSKSYTTAETLLNAEGAYELMRTHNLDPAKHVVTVAGKDTPGDDPSNPVVETFHMFDFFGGRYSVTSAVGGVPLSLYLGNDKFERFLQGAHEMDRHALTAVPERNLPLTAALLSIWNNNHLGYSKQAIIPYADPLAKLAPHVQQLYMESVGKGVDLQGRPLDVRSGVTIYGEPGTNAQHSFFQSQHQGDASPVDFIGVRKSQYPQIQTKRGDVTNHQELWANLLSQANTLAAGEKGSTGHQRFPGNRPSSIITMQDLSPESVGRLLAFYEHRTVYEAFIWGLNPFDQPGVQLGKVNAQPIREALAGFNNTGKLESVNPLTDPYLQALTGSGGLPYVE